MIARPAVSVVMPAYECEAFIGAAMASVLSQTRGDLELIVVDDGSSDGTAAVAAAVGDDRVRVIRRPHAGISAAMNAGLALARAPTFARLDTDDVWSPSFLEVAGAALGARADVAYARTGAMTVDGRPTGGGGRGRPMPFPDRPFASMLLADFTSNIAILARRECWERVGGFDESFVANEDWEFWLRVSRHFRFVFVDEVLAWFRERPSSITRANPLTAIDERVRVLDKAFSSLRPEDGIDARIRGRAYRNLFFETGFVHWKAGSRWPGARAFARGLRESDSVPRAALRLLYEVGLRRLGHVATVGRLRTAASRLRRAP